MLAGSPSAVRGAAFAFIFITVVLDMLAVGIMAPVLPKLVLSLEGGHVAAAAMVIGVFGLVWAGMQFLFSPLIGILSDRYGRRPIILLSNFGLGLDYILMALAPSVPWLLFGRIVSGITSASFPTAIAYIADVTPQDRRAARIGALGGAFGLGFTLGPAIGGFLGEIDIRLPFWVAAGLSLANAAYGFLVLPESLGREHRKAFDWRKASPLNSLYFLAEKPGVLTLAGAAFLCFLGHEALQSTFVLYTTYRFGWTESQVGMALTAVGIGSVLVSGILIRPTIARFGDDRVMLTGLSFGILGFIGYGLAPNGSLLLLGTPLLALWGLAMPAMQSVMTREVEPSAQGELQGALNSLRGIAGLLGPLAFTQAFVVGACVSNPLHAPGAPYLLAAALLMVALGTSAWSLRLASRLQPKSAAARVPSPQRRALGGVQADSAAL